MDEIATYERDPANMESRIESVFADADVEAELPQADLDMLDVCFSMASGLVGVFVATNDDVAKWLEKVHDAASGNPGDCGVVQQMLGSLLFHKGDALDVYAPEEGFIARNGERAYVMFHRLLFGHDVLATGRGLMPYNPFELMYQQKGLMGIVQAVRHLLAARCPSKGCPCLEARTSTPSGKAAGLGTGSSTGFKSFPSRRAATRRWPRRSTPTCSRSEPRTSLQAASSPSLSDAMPSPAR